MQIAPNTESRPWAKTPPCVDAPLEKEPWGIASAIDIYDCDPEKIRCAETIRRFVVELCDLIEMKRFGETQVVHFGEDERVAGYSMVQLIRDLADLGPFCQLDQRRLSRCFQLQSLLTRKPSRRLRRTFLEATAPPST